MDTLDTISIDLVPHEIDVEIEPDLQGGYTFYTYPELLEKLNVIYNPESINADVIRAIFFLLNPTAPNNVVTPNLKTLDPGRQDDKYRLMSFAELRDYFKFTKVPNLNEELQPERVDNSLQDLNPGALVKMRRLILFMQTFLGKTAAKDRYDLLRRMTTPFFSYLRGDGTIDQEAINSLIPYLKESPTSASPAGADFPAAIAKAARQTVDAAGGGGGGGAELQPEPQRPRLQRRGRLGVGPYSRKVSRTVRVPLSQEELARIENLEQAENERRLAAVQNGTSTNSVPVQIQDAVQVFVQKGGSREEASRFLATAASDGNENDGEVELNPPKGRRLIERPPETERLLSGTAPPNSPAVTEYLRSRITLERTPRKILGLVQEGNLGGALEEGNIGIKLGLNNLVGISKLRSIYPNDENLKGYEKEIKKFIVLILGGLLSIVYSGTIFDILVNTVTASVGLASSAASAGSAAVSTLAAQGLASAGGFAASTATSAAATAVAVAPIVVLPLATIAVIQVARNAFNSNPQLFIGAALQEKTWDGLTVEGEKVPVDPHIHMAVRLINNTSSGDLSSLVQEARKDRVLQLEGEISTLAGEGESAESKQTETSGAEGGALGAEGNEGVEEEDLRSECIRLLFGTAVDLIDNGDIPIKTLQIAQILSTSQTFRVKDFAGRAIDCLKNEENEETVVEFFTTRFKLEGDQIQLLRSHIRLCRSRIPKGIFDQLGLSPNSSPPSRTMLQQLKDAAKTPSPKSPAKTTTLPSSGSPERVGSPSRASSTSTASAASPQPSPTVWGNTLAAFRNAFQTPPPSSPPSLQNRASLSRASAAAAGGGGGEGRFINTLSRPAPSARSGSREEAPFREVAPIPLSKFLEAPVGDGGAAAEEVAALGAALEHPPAAAAAEALAAAAGEGGGGAAAEELAAAAGGGGGVGVAASFRELFEAPAAAAGVGGAAGAAPGGAGALPESLLRLAQETADRAPSVLRGDEERERLVTRLREKLGKILHQQEVFEAELETRNLERGGAGGIRPIDLLTETLRTRAGILRPDVKEVVATGLERFGTVGRAFGEHTGADYQGLKFINSLDPSEIHVFNIIRRFYGYGDVERGGYTGYSRIDTDYQQFLNSIQYNPSATKTLMEKIDRFLGGEPQNFFNEDVHGRQKVLRKVLFGIPEGQPGHVEKQFYYTPEELRKTTF